MAARRGPDGRLADYDERVLPSIVNEVLKQAVAQFNASELLTQRDRVSRKVRNDLIERAADFHILLEDVSIIDLSFGREFTAAVEAKQVGASPTQPAPPRARCRPALTRSTDGRSGPQQHSRRRSGRASWWRRPSKRSGPS